MRKFDFAEPAQLHEVSALLRRYGDDAKLFAGGTALLQFLKKGLVRPAVLVSLRRLAELRGVEPDHGGLRIGAMVSHREMEWSGPVQAIYPSLWAAEAGVANPRIRNMATVGGNLCHADPNQDPPVALIALGGRLRVMGPRGERFIPAEEFFRDYYENALEPGEVLVSIHLPAPGERVHTAYTKFSPRTADDFGTVTCCAALEVDPGTGVCRTARLAVGCVHSVPWRSRAAENLLAGGPVTADRAAAAAASVAAEVHPAGDVRGSAGYKREMVKVMVRRTILRAAAGSVQRGA